MSTTIDQRVVEMQFDNRHFENNVSATMSSLDKLKKSLNFNGATKGLEEVDYAAKKVDMSALGSAVDAIQSKFSAMGVIGATALANITNSAINTGKTIASALGVDPIKSGLSEYETQINAVQTILANTESKGTTLDDVNNALDTLNTYADKTIYNFTEMTRNIGTFTAAGVDLDTSVNAIQGIANLAAVSGSTSQQASTAMYQLSQALASGTVKLMDWNSVVNAGMGGQVFQDALKETARVHGVNIDQMIKDQGSFRETLSSGWLTADILTETLSKFTMTTDGLTAAEIAANREKLKNIGYTDEQIDGIFKLGKTATDAATKVKTFTQLWDTLKETAQSGWTQTWELIFGDFEGAKNFFSGLYQTLSPLIEATAAARNELLKGWNKAGGRDDLIKSIYNVFEGIRSLIKPIKEGFREIFPALTVQQLVNFTSKLQELTSRMKLSSETSDKLRRTFKGVFAIFDIAGQALSAIFSGLGPVLKVIGLLASGILSVTANIGDWLVGLDNGIRKLGIFRKIVNAVVNVFDILFTVVKKAGEILDAVFGAIGDFIHGVSDGMFSVFKDLGSSLEEFGSTGLIKSIANGVGVASEAIIKAITVIGKALGSFVSDTDFTSFLDVINTIITGGLGYSIWQFVDNLKVGFGGLTEVFEMFRDCLESYQDNLEASSLLRIAGAIALLAGSMWLLSTIDNDSLYDAIVAMLALFGGLVGAVKLITSNLTGTLKFGVLSLALINLSVAVLILASALKVIGDLGLEKIAGGIVAIASLMGMLIGTVKLIGGNASTIIKGSIQMVVFAAAVRILASACRELGMLNFGELCAGLAGVAVLLAEILVFTKTMSSTPKLMSTAIGMLIIAAAIKLIASACDDFARIPADGLLKGLGTMELLLTRLEGTGTRSASAAIGMVFIAVSMKIAASAFEDMAKISWSGVLKGAIAFTATIGMMTYALNLMKYNAHGMPKAALALVAFTASLYILSEALVKIGSMSWGGVARALTSITVCLTLIIITLMSLDGSKAFAGAGALVIAAVALSILGSTISKLGKLSWEEVARGLIVVASAFAIIGVAGLLLKPLIPTLLSLAATFVLIGAGAALIGVGLMGMGMGLSAIAAGLVALVGAFGLAGSILTNMIASLVAGVIKGIADGIIAFCQIIIDGAPAIGKAITVLVLAVLDVLRECIPPIVDVCLELIFRILESLVKFTPGIVDAIFDLVIGLLDGIAKRLPDLIKSLVGIVVALIQGVIDALGDVRIDISLDDIINIGAMAGVMVAMAALAPLVPAAMAGVLGFGALIAELAIVLAAVGALSFLPGLTWLVDKGGDLLEAIGTTIGRFIGGIAGGIAQGVTSSLPDMAYDLSSFMRRLQPFIEGARLIDESVVSGVQSLIKMVLALTAADVIQSIASWVTGSSSIGTFASELPALGRGLKSFSDSVAGVNPENVIAASKAARVLAQMTETIPNEGGVLGWFVGENSISAFGGELYRLGKGLKSFSDSVVGLSPENVVAASEAAKALSGMTETIPNAGGVVAWFTGENSITRFADDIVELGIGLKGFSHEVRGTVPANVTAAAEAARALAQMTTYIPNSGGVAAWFTGENSITRFAKDIVKLGTGLRGFSYEVTGIVPANVIAASNAAKAIAEMTNHIPNQGGMVAWFTGDSSISKFAAQLPALGAGLLGFSVAVAGILPEKVTAGANAAKALAEMTNTLPNQGGMVAWFTGDESIARFSVELGLLGRGIARFGENVADINPESIVAGASAAKALAEMTNTLPNEGGIKAWFAGETSITKFAGKLPDLGKGLAGFYTAFAESETDPAVMTAAANAGKSLAEMVSVIPTEGGIKAWFTGETSVANFADKLPKLGEGLAGFASAISEGEVDPTAVTASANAAKALGEMTNIIPKNTDKIEKFGANLEKFGKKLAAYFTATKDITSESISNTTEVIDVVERISTIDSGNVRSISGAINDIAKSIKNLSKIPKDSTSEFSKAMKKLGEASAEKLVKALEDIKKDTKKAGEDAMNAFIEGIKSVSSDAEKACTALAEACAEAIGDAASDFSSAGADLVDGFASGISSNSFRAAAKARAMARAAATAAKEELDINSPSKVFRAIGTSVPEGFAMGIDKFTGMVRNSSTSMADTAIGTVSKSISMLADMINTDIDAQPTIRPVLDLSDIKSGARSLSGLLGMGSSIGVSANIGAISSMMNQRIQNGNNDDVVSAINKLGKGLSGMRGDTYNIGVTDNDDANVQEAVRTIVRAARIGGRV